MLNNYHKYVGSGNFNDCVFEVQLETKCFAPPQNMFGIFYCYDTCVKSPEKISVNPNFLDNNWMIIVIT